MEPLEIIVGLADDPALEFLNTTAIPAPGAAVIELIGDGRAYLDWLNRSGMIDDQAWATIRDLFTSAELDDVAATARDVRDRLRPIVEAWMTRTSSAIPKEWIDELNTLLAADDRRFRLYADDQGVALRDQRQWTAPAQLLVPPAEACARLFARGDRRLVRQCEGCTIIFYDRTKAHRRRWCSMAICGNREKVRRYRASVPKKTGHGPNSCP
ncbi:CGNR zinc finger domain-containing protein [Mycobacterium sp. MMS18-G62]